MLSNQILIPQNEAVPLFLCYGIIIYSSRLYYNNITMLLRTVSFENSDKSTEILTSKIWDCQKMKPSGSSLYEQLHTLYWLKLKPVSSTNSFSHKYSNLTCKTDIIVEVKKTLQCFRMFFVVFVVGVLCCAVIIVYLYSHIVPKVRGRKHLIYINKHSYILIVFYK